MSNKLLQSLEEKINHALDIIETLRLQLEEAEQNNNSLKIENSELQNRQLQWEQSLSSLLKKLSSAELSDTTTNTKRSEKRHLDGKHQELSQTVISTEEWPEEDPFSQQDRTMEG